MLIHAGLLGFHPMSSHLGARIRKEVVAEFNMAAADFSFGHVTPRLSALKRDPVALSNTTNCLFWALVSLLK